ncbi:MAG: proprotein convertase P-domain-containing protein [Beijerinckiaceae bacterium]|nr:proprotein convertase P-domain-containing protein [Beijerinckiaceae bacterium]MCI0736522.1 proprotein convertase P-domain-containing protein [Beijerinckiaceae bacterium]
MPGSELRARLSLFCGAFLLGIGWAAAADDAAGKKTDPARAAMDDPRSSAALNVLAAKAAKAAGKLAPRGPAPQYIFHSTVNNPAADTTAQDTQSETTIIDLGGGNLVAGFNDSGSFLGGASHFTGYAWSNTNGISWNDPGTLPASAEGDAGDPVLAYHKASDSVFFSTLGFTTGENIQVFKSTDKGHTFGAPVNGTPGFGGTGAFQDKEWLAVDNFAGTGNGNVYLCWTQFGPGSIEDIRFTRSTDGGATFGPSSGTLISTGGQGCFVAVSPSHQVNVFYYRGTGPGGQGGDNKIFTRRSLDLGITFQPEVEVADLNTTSTNGNLGLNGGLRSNSFPHAAVNPVAARPYIYVVYNDIDPALPAVKTEIFYTRSLDGGLTWSAPAKAAGGSGDQFFPTVAFISAGERLMFGYYSRSHDPLNLAFHRRGRQGVLAAPGGIGSLPPSFQLSPNTPVVIGQDPVINPTYMGDYDVIAGGAGTFANAWSDNRLGNGFHARQPDVRFARIAATPPSADLSVGIGVSPASIGLGQTTVFTATAASAGGIANDTFINLRAPVGLALQSVNTASGQCSNIDGFIDCSLGSIAAGASKSIQIVAAGVIAAGTRTLSARGTTSSADPTFANNTTSASVSVAAEAVAGSSHSSGSIAVPIPDTSSVEVPLTVPAVGYVVHIVPRVRLNHTFDSDLRLSLIAPTGQTVSLSNRRGGSGDNYGSGANDCSGTLSAFSDAAATPVSAGAAPFAGTFRPDQPLMSVLAGVPTDGVWKLRVEDLVGGDTGTIGCFALTIVRNP